MRTGTAYLPLHYGKASAWLFEKMKELAMEGVGPKTIRALSLISELLYGTPPSFRDPAKFSFAHGGKDGIPYPIDRENYERSIEILRRSLSQARLGNREKLEAMKRLSVISEEERK